MSSKVKISYNSDEEMMSIESDGAPIQPFYGNYWDFSREPQAIAEFLRRLGHEVIIDEDLTSIG